MINLIASPTENTLFLLFGSDPNTKSENFIRIKGVSSIIKNFKVKVLGANPKLEFHKEYENLDSSKSSFMEFYTYMPKGSYHIEISLDDYKKTLSIEF